MRITWSLPVPGESLASSRGDMVRARRLIHELREQGHEVRVVSAAEGAGVAAGVSAYRGGVRRMLPRRAAGGLRDVGRLALARAHGRRVAAEARRQGADLLVETQVHGVPSGALASRLTGLPLVLDDCSPAGEELALQAGLPVLARWAFRRQVAAAARLVVSSRALADRLEGDGVPRRALAVVGNGTDVAARTLASVPARASADWLADPGGPHDHRYEGGSGPPGGWAAPEGTVAVVFVGSFQPWHRVDLLVDAVAALAASRPVHLLLLGEGATRAAALERAAARGLAELVSAPGAVRSQELPGILAACDVGALAGTNDYGQPMKLLEYAAAGLPAIAPDLPPVRDVLSDGVTGLLFTPGDLASLTASMARLVDDAGLRRRLGTAAREACLGASWTVRGRELEAVVLRAAGREARP